LKHTRLLWLSFAIACHTPEARTAPPEQGGTPPPQWQDALPASPELLVQLRPKLLRSNDIYGPMLRRALQLVHEQRVPSGSLVLDAIEDADEAVAELGNLASSETTPGSQELLLVLRGIRADLDPARLVGPDGDILWSPGPSGRVRELVHEQDHDGTANPASLFELEDRTWVVASGSARDRTRDAFAHPSHRPEPAFASEALAAITIDGPSLVASVALLQSSGALASIGRGLRSLALELLAPGPLPEGPRPVDDQVSPGQIRALLSYADSQGADAAGSAMRVILAVVSRVKPAALAWLTAKDVEIAGRTVALTEPVPRDLLDHVLYAGRATQTPR
jgi:hypothetical protein